MEGLLARYSRIHRRIFSSDPSVDNCQIPEAVKELRERCGKRQYDRPFLHLGGEDPMPRIELSPGSHETPMSRYWRSRF
jgi:hypothetical protein